MPVPYTTAVVPRASQTMARKLPELIFVISIVATWQYFGLRPHFICSTRPAQYSDQVHPQGVRRGCTGLKHQLHMQAGYAARMWVTMRLRDQRSCGITSTQPANSSSASCSTRSVSTSRSSRKPGSHYFCLVVEPAVFRTTNRVPVCFASWRAFSAARNRACGTFCRSGSFTWDTGHFICAALPL